MGCKNKSTLLARHSTTITGNKNMLINEWLNHIKPSVANFAISRIKSMLKSSPTTTYLHTHSWIVNNTAYSLIVLSTSEIISMPYGTHVEGKHCKTKRCQSGQYHAPACSLPEDMPRKILADWTISVIEGLQFFTTRKPSWRKKVSARQQCVYEDP